MGNHGEAHYSAMRNNSTFEQIIEEMQPNQNVETAGAVRQALAHINMALKHTNKVRWALSREGWLMNRMNEFPGGGSMVYGEPPPWAAEAIAMLRMVEANKEIPGLGFRYNDGIFYIEGALEKNDQIK